MMSYYKRLLGQGRTGSPSVDEANEDFARMLDARYPAIRHLGDHGRRYHR